MIRLLSALVLISSLAHADTGSVKGTVIFEGEPPTQKKQDRSVDKKCLPQDAADEAVVVAHGKLRDVLVRIKNGTIGDHKPPAEPVVIDQRGCTYAPRVVGLVAGQKLVVRNSDATTHNVHGTLRGKDVVNKMQSQGSPELSIDPTAAKADDIVALACNVHPWMAAYAVVQDHPFFAVTGDDGKFEIKGLPPGKYTLEAWHPVLGTRTVNIEIGKGGRANVTARLSYKASD